MNEGAGPMRSILVASDLSPRSDRAVQRALILGETWALPVTVLHVVDEAMPPELAENVAGYARRHLHNQVQTRSGVQATVQVQVGRSYRDILTAADGIDAEIIVLGCHRETGIGDHIAGTVVERVIRRGHRPVLVVISGHATHYRKVLVCVDFSVQSHRAMRYAADLIPDGRFYFVHAYQIPFHGFMRGGATHHEVRATHEARVRKVVQRQMEAFGTTAAPFHAQVERIVEEGPPLEVIGRQVERIRPDLVVIGTHGRTGVAHLLLGSVAEELVSRPPCDVLVVKGW